MREELKYGQTKTVWILDLYWDLTYVPKKMVLTNFDAICGLFFTHHLGFLIFIFCNAIDRCHQSLALILTLTGGTTKMRLSNLCLLALSAPVVAFAFLPQSFKSLTNVGLRSPNRIDNLVDVQTSWSQDECSFTQLNMAFQSDKESNMFDGPMALTKERDACGVGFVANTKSGGKDVPFERLLRNDLD